VKQNISLAPNNASAWNYLRGVLEFTKHPLSTVATFVQLYTVPLADDATDLVDVEHPPPGYGAELPCTAAIEFLADVYEEEATSESVDKAVEVCFCPSIFLSELLHQLQLWKSLAEEHDTIRKK
jgi:protein farnesyltransferase/geranylgeranyltransferase type-1 subunit alpha